eukprot:TRINITY_DN214_c0_g1_i1.p1 TRINITY_DN214_c0_g1~~TRINITY_DN214_c0_g1_i1.p1  ORF type:complete len:205 (+),score=40.84 TRINITY_DN214_c0_g1_i1:52-615(+)
MSERHAWKYLQEVHESDKQLEESCSSLKERIRKLIDLHNKSLRDVNEGGRRGPAKTSYEVDGEAMRRKLVALADHPLKLEEEKNLDSLVEEAVELLDHDKADLEEIFKQKPNRVSTRKEVEQEIEKLNNKLDDKYLREIQRLRDFITNKDKEPEEETVDRGETDPTVIEYMIENYESVFSVSAEFRI